MLCVVRCVVRAALLSSQSWQRRVFVCASSMPLPKPGITSHHSFVHKGVEREYWLHTPCCAARSRGPLPLVFMLHGWDETGAQYAGLQPGTFGHEGADRWKEESERGCFYVAWPQGRSTKLGTLGKIPSWNAGGCSSVGAESCDTAEVKREYGRFGLCPRDSACDAACPACAWCSCEDDVGFLITLARSLVASPHLGADQSRCYVAGCSNGGMMAFELAMRAPAGLFAAIVTNSGLPHRGHLCAPQRLPPILHIHAAVDHTIPADGTPSHHGGWKYVKAQEALSQLGASAGCTAAPAVGQSLEWVRLSALEATPQDVGAFSGGETSGSMPSADSLLFVGDSDIERWDTDALFPGSRNLGVGGYTCERVLSELDGYLTAYHGIGDQGQGVSGGRPLLSWAIVVCGENDLAYEESVETTFGYFEQVVTKLTATGARVLSMSTKPEPSTTDIHSKYKRYDLKVKQLAETLASSSGAGAGGARPPLVIIDSYHGFMDLGNHGNLYASDGLHLSSRGYAHWNDWMTTALLHASDSCLVWRGGVCVSWSSPRPPPPPEPEADTLPWLHDLAFAAGRQFASTAGDGRCALQAACDGGGDGGATASKPPRELVYCTGSFGHDWPAWAATVSWRFFSRYSTTNTSVRLGRPRHSPTSGTPLPVCEAFDENQQAHAPHLLDFAPSDSSTSDSGEVLMLDSPLLNPSPAPQRENDEEGEEGQEGVVDDSVCTFPPEAPPAASAPSLATLPSADDLLAVETSALIALWAGAAATCLVLVLVVVVACRLRNRRARIGGGGRQHAATIELEAMGNNEEEDATGSPTGALYELNDAAVAAAAKDAGHEEEDPESTTTATRI